MNCTKCGKDISSERIKIQRNGEWYCYECKEKISKHSKTNSSKRKKRRNKISNIQVRNMLKEGLKPSQIARILNINVVDVYKASS